MSSRLTFPPECVMLLDMETTRQEKEMTLSQKIIANPNLRHVARDLYRSALRLEIKRRRASIDPTAVIRSHNVEVSRYYAS